MKGTLSRLHTDVETVQKDWDDIPSLPLNERGEPRETPRPFVPAINVSTMYGTDDEDVIDSTDIESDVLFFLNHRSTREDPPPSPITQYAVRTGGSTALLFALY